jgi:hypothetical protein
VTQRWLHVSFYGEGVGDTGCLKGEKRDEAMELIELTYRKHPDIQTAEAAASLVYRLKQGVGGLGDTSSAAGPVAQCPKERRHQP